MILRRDVRYCDGPLLAMLLVTEVDENGQRIRYPRTCTHAATFAELRDATSQFDLLETVYKKMENRIAKGQPYTVWSGLNGKG